MNKSKELWNSNACIWTKGISESLDMTRKVIGLPKFMQEVGEVHEKKILDLGCGEGEISRSLSEHNQVDGVDFSEKLINSAKTASKAKTNVKYYVDDAVEFMKKQQNCKYDLILSYMVLSCMEPYEQVVIEAQRILKTNGKFIFVVLHPAFNNCYSSWVDGSGMSKDLHISGYNDSTKYDHEFSFLQSPNKIQMQEIRYHRTFAQYINPLALNNFTICKVIEPVAEKEFTRKNNILKRWSKFPCFLLISAKKL